MKYSQLFLKTSKESPKDETAKNADLLIRGGFIHKEMAGIYSFLPLGLRVLDKISAIVSEEMNRAGSSKMLMSAICPAEGRSAERSMGLDIAKQIGNFWQVVSGDIKVENRRDVEDINAKKSDDK